MRRRSLGNPMALLAVLVLCFGLAGCGEDDPRSPGTSRYDTEPGWGGYDTQPGTGRYDTEPGGGSTNPGGVPGDDYGADDRYSTTPGPYDTTPGGASGVSGDDYYRAPAVRKDHDAAYLRLQESMKGSQAEQEAAYKRYRLSDVNYQTGRRK